MSWRAFWRGAASIMDFTGALGPRYEPLTDEQAAQADAAAMASDWKAAGDAMKQAIAHADVLLGAQAEGQAAQRQARRRRRRRRP
jgi:hypothetical protein